MAPKVVGKASRVVETDGLTIDEYAGNVGSLDDRMSLAVVKISKPCSEPWLTLDYDEWIGILKGKIEFYFLEEGEETKIVATTGETVFVPKGQRFRPVFPEGGTEYVPVCIPAFKPERCLREEDGGYNTSDVASKLKELHSESSKTTTTVVTSSSDYPDTLYHMCEKSLWDAAVASGQAYFPPTFEKDGNFTHATAVPSRLLETANHFYTASTDAWICLQMSARTLKDNCGIITTFEEPKPVGDQDVQQDWRSSNWACPHIYGGIPVSIPGIVENTYEMKRDDQGNFLSIVGLTDQ
jgi:uncharacterized protein (DUF952 family)